MCCSDPCKNYEVSAAKCPWPRSPSRFWGHLYPHELGAQSVFQRCHLARPFWDLFGKDGRDVPGTLFYLWSDQERIISPEAWLDSLDKGWPRRCVHPSMNAYRSPSSSHGYVIFSATSALSPEGFEGIAIFEDPIQDNKLIQPEGVSHRSSLEGLRILSPCLDNSEPDAA